MNKNDVIFAIICGLAVAWVASDFFKKYGAFFLIALPAFSIIGLWVADAIGKKFLFVHQLGKFGLAGAFADVVDIKVFQLLFWLLPWPGTSVLKATSYIIATFVKYFSDKHWTFEKPEKKDMHKEMAKFFIVALCGLLINVVSFHYFSKIKTGISTNLWLELSVIFAALVSAVWNFSGYKFIVFKK